MLGFVVSWSGFVVSCLELFVSWMVFYYSLDLIANTLDLIANTLDLIASDGSFDFDFVEVSYYDSSVTALEMSWNCFGISVVEASFLGSDFLICSDRISVVWNRRVCRGFFGVGLNWNRRLNLDCSLLGSAGPFSYLIGTRGVGQNSLHCFGFPPCIFSWWCRRLTRHFQGL